MSNALVCQDVDDAISSVHTTVGMCVQLYAEKVLRGVPRGGTTKSEAYTH